MPRTRDDDSGDNGGGEGAFLSPKQERLLVVANRLPMTVTPSSSSERGYGFTMSSGGLVSGLRGIKGIDFVWIGWPGNEVPEPDRSYVTDQCAQRNCHPVFLDQETIDLFYNGFCNNVLWPLFHYIPPPMDIVGRDNSTDEGLWDAYVSANLTFVEAVLQVYKDNDAVWVHDYHLMLVPRLLRARKPDAKIGWFLHTPFPSQEMFRMLPFRTELLTGLLSANFIGFHVYDYLRHFISSCVQLLGLESTAHGVDAQAIGGVFVYCGAIPIGIEPQQFFRKLKDPSLREAVRKLRAQFGQKKVILGVDRLDYMKGVPHKLNAFDRFLELHPEWNEQCVLVQLAVPTRTVVPEYQRLKSTVHQLVGSINGRRGNLTHVPVHYLDQSLSFDELVALYRVADVALITSLRDGMNLVAYEFIACQAGRHGVLVLSEFAGAAQSLGAGSIRINPWNLDETAAAIHQALSMSRAQRRSRHDYALKHVMVHTSQRWSEIFLDSLREASERNDEVRDTVPPPLPVATFVQEFMFAKRRLLLIDLIDSLTPARGVKGLPMKKFKKLIQLPTSTFVALEALSKEENTTVLVTTAHPMSTLQRLFGHTKICLAAEKGCVYRGRDGQWVRFVGERSAGTIPMPPATSETSDSAASNPSSAFPSSQQSPAPTHSSDTTEPHSELAVLTSVSSATASATTESSTAPLVETVANDWMAGVEKIFKFFERRTPGSYTERTTGTLTWYWDDTMPDFGKQQSRDLLVHLWTAPLANSASADLEVVVGPRFIEVRSSQCSRSRLLQHILNYEFASTDNLPLDFAACIGNFPRRDEDIHALFETLAAPRSIPTGLSTEASRTELYEDKQLPSVDSFSVSEKPEEPGSENYFDSCGVGDKHISADEVLKRRESNKSESTKPESIKPESTKTASSGAAYFSVSVGAGTSRSRFCLQSVNQVQVLIEQLTAVLNGADPAQLLQVLSQSSPLADGAGESPFMPPYFRTAAGDQSASLTRMGLLPVTRRRSDHFDAPGRRRRSVMGSSLLESAEPVVTDTVPGENNLLAPSPRHSFDRGPPSDSLIPCIPAATSLIVPSLTNMVAGPVSMVQPVLAPSNISSAEKIATVPRPRRFVAALPADCPNAADVVNTHHPIVPANVGPTAIQTNKAGAFPNPSGHPPAPAAVSSRYRNPYEPLATTVVEPPYTRRQRHRVDLGTPAANEVAPTNFNQKLECGNSAQLIYGNPEELAAQTRPNPTHLDEGPAQQWEVHSRNQQQLFSFAGSVGGEWPLCQAPSRSQQPNSSVEEVPLTNSGPILRSSVVHRNNTCLQPWQAGAPVGGGSAPGDRLLSQFRNQHISSSDVAASSKFHTTRGQSSTWFHHEPVEDRPMRYVHRHNNNNNHRHRHEYRMHSQHNNRFEGRRNERRDARAAASALATSVVEPRPAELARSEEGTLPADVFLQQPHSSTFNTGPTVIQPPSPTQQHGTQVTPHIPTGSFQPHRHW